MDIQELLLSGKDNLVHGKLQESADDFTKVLEMDPKMKIAYFSRGSVYLKMQNFKSAIADFTAYIKIDPANEKVYCSLGTAYLGSGDTERALKEYNKAIELNPHYPNGYFGRSETLTKMGEEEQAAQDKQVGDRLQQQISKAFYESQGIYQDSSLAS